MIPKELEARILRLFHVEKWPVGSIAGQLGVHYSTVRRVLAQAGVPLTALPRRPSKIDPYLLLASAGARRFRSATSCSANDLVRNLQAKALAPGFGPAQDPPLRTA